MQRARRKYMFSLYDLNCLWDGLIILQAFEKILPGSAVLRRVSKPNGGAQRAR
ncbi:hypothetical protein DFH29DRAFT_917277 [Suillus ampliporus]|nr:hypothetical protein DFH29DRAFT_917277 [Suillus ampliporus]